MTRDERRLPEALKVKGQLGRQDAAVYLGERKLTLEQAMTLARDLERSVDEVDPGYCICTAELRPCPVHRIDRRGRRG